MLQSFILILPIFLLIGLGYVLFKIKIADESWEVVLSKYALNIGFPALIVNAMSKIEGSLNDYTDSIVLNSVLISCLFFIAFIVGKIMSFKQETNSALFICAVFSNIGFMGIPVLQYVYGDTVLPNASIIASMYIFGVFTIGIGYLEYQKTGQFKLKEIFGNLLKNPLLLAVLVGLILHVFNITMFKPINEVVKMLANSVTPVIMMVVGIFMARSDFGKLKEWLAPLLFAIYTLVLMPALCYLFVFLFDFNTSINYPAIIVAGMPCAVTPFAMAIKYDMNKTFIARSIILSTILSIISLPVWIEILS